jgi:hypothetical protein
LGSKGTQFEYSQQKQLGYGYIFVLSFKMKILLSFVFATNVLHIKNKEQKRAVTLFCAILYTKQNNLNQRLDAKSGLSRCSLSFLEEGAKPAP